MLTELVLYGAVYTCRYIGGKYCETVFWFGISDVFYASLKRGHDDSTGKDKMIKP